MHYDLDKLRGAFFNQKNYNKLTYKKVAQSAKVAVSTVHHVIETGNAHPETMDKVALALGFQHGAADVTLRGRRSA